MFFSAYLGSDAGGGFRAWCRAVAWHAHRLGLTTLIERRAVGGEATAVLGLAWIEHPAAAADARPRLIERDGSVVVRTYGAPAAGDLDLGRPLWETLAGDPDANAIRLTVSLRDGTLRAAVSPTTPEQLYYARVEEGWVFADDLRLFPYLTSAELDPVAIYALLRFSAVPPTLTPYREVRRVPNGHVAGVGRDAQAVLCERFVDLVDLPQRSVGEEEAQSLIRRGLDAVLAPLPPGAVLFFSGGVDSGLLAARLAAIDRRDVRLVNYAFSASDEEHQVAMSMATRLGFRCELIAQQPEQTTEVLQRARRDYTFPFGDISTIPTNVLVHGALSVAQDSGVVVEGTGADGAYGLAASYGKWRRAYGLPLSVRQLIGWAYARLGWWASDTVLERAARIIRKSGGLPLSHAVVAQNALEGIAYEADPAVVDRLAKEVGATLEAIASGPAPEDAPSLLDLMWVCAGRMAPKSFDPLRVHGIRTVYPYLEPSMLAVSSSLPWRIKCAGGEAKGILKRILAQAVPEQWVYRRKTGFTRTASSREIFASPPVQEFMRESVLGRGGPLSSYCHADVILELVERARAHALSVGAYILLWTLAFGSAWLHQTEPQPPADWVPDPAVHRGSAWVEPATRPVERESV